MARPRSMKYCECCKTNVILNHSNTKYCRNCGRYILNIRTITDQKRYREIRKIKEDLKK